MPMVPERTQRAALVCSTPSGPHSATWASSSQPTGWRGRRLASTAPTVAALTRATPGAEVPLGQVGPAGVAQLLVQPGDHQAGDHRERPYGPGDHARPAAAPGESGSRGHWHGPRRIQALRSPGILTSLVGEVPVWPPSVSQALRTGDHPNAWSPHPASGPAHQKEAKRPSGMGSLALERSCHAPDSAVPIRWWLGSVGGRGSRRDAACRPRVGAGALAA
jgi:hypothetical protein